MESIEQDQVHIEQPLEENEIENTTIVDDHDSSEDILLGDVVEKHTDSDLVDLLSEDLSGDEVNIDVFMDDKEEDNDIDTGINEAVNKDAADQPVTIVDEAPIEINNDKDVDEAAVTANEAESPIEYVSPQRENEDNADDLEEFEVIENKEEGEEVVEGTDNHYETRDNEEPMFDTISESTSPKATHTTQNENQSEANDNEDQDQFQVIDEQSEAINELENEYEASNENENEGDFQEQKEDVSEGQKSKLDFKLTEDNDGEGYISVKENSEGQKAVNEHHDQESLEQSDDLEQPQGKEPDSDAKMYEDKNEEERNGRKNHPQDTPSANLVDQQESDNEGEQQEKIQIIEDYQETDEPAFTHENEDTIESEYCPLPVILQTDVFPYLLCPISPENYSKLPSEYENVINLYDDTSILKLSLSEIFGHIRETFNEHGNPFNEDEELVLTFKDFDHTSIEESNLLSETLLLQDIIEMFGLIRFSKKENEEIPECLCLLLSSRKSFRSQMKKIWELKLSQGTHFEDLSETGTSEAGQKLFDEFKEDEFELSEEELSEVNKAMGSDEENQEEGKDNGQEKGEESEYEGSPTKRSIGEVEEDAANDEGNVPKKQK